MSQPTQPVRASTRRLGIAAKIALGLVVVPITLSALLVVLLIVVWNSAWGRAHILSFALDIANDSIQGQLHAEDLDGDLISGLSLNNIRVRDPEGNVVASLQRVEVEYALRSFLDDNTIKIERLYLEAPQFTVLDDDGEVALSRAFAPREPSPPSETPPPIIVVEDLVISDTAIQLDPSLHAPRATALDVTLAALRVEDTDIQWRELVVDATWEHLPVAVNKTTLTTSGSMQGPRVRLDTLGVTTPQATLSLHGDINDLETLALDLTLERLDVDLDKLATLLPDADPLPIQGKAQMRGRVVGSRALGFDLVLALASPGGQLDLDGHVTLPGEAPLRYRADLRLRDGQPSSLVTALPPVIDDLHDLDLDLRIEGSANPLEQGHAHAALTLHRVASAGLGPLPEMTPVVLEANMVNDDVSLSVETPEQQSHEPRVTLGVVANLTREEVALTLRDVFYDGLGLERARLNIDAALSEHAQQVEGGGWIEGFRQGDAATLQRGTVSLNVTRDAVSGVLDGAVKVALDEAGYRDPSVEASLGVLTLDAKGRVNPLPLAVDVKGTLESKRLAGAGVSLASIKSDFEVARGDTQIWHVKGDLQARDGRQSAEAVQLGALQGHYDVMLPDEGGLKAFADLTANQLRAGVLGLDRFTGQVRFEQPEDNVMVVGAKVSVANLRWGKMASIARLRLDADQTVSMDEGAPRELKGRAVLTVGDIRWGDSISVAALELDADPVVSMGKDGLRDVSGRAKLKVEKVKTPWKKIHHLNVSARLPGRRRASVRWDVRAEEIGLQGDMDLTLPLGGRSTFGMMINALQATSGPQKLDIAPGARVSYDAANEAVRVRDLEIKGGRQLPGDIKIDLDWVPKRQTYDGHLNIVAARLERWVRFAERSAGMSFGLPEALNATIDIDAALKGQGRKRPRGEVLSLIHI